MMVLVLFCKHCILSLPLVQLSPPICTHSTKPNISLVNYLLTPPDIFIPTACSDYTTPCHLHVAIHGCKQGQEFIGSTFSEHTGYNKWAENNNITVLYPQIAKDVSHGNPDGCWDWWGYLGKDYALKSGVQMAFLKKVIDAVRG
jgi:hypothetical protein